MTVPEQLHASPIDRPVGGGMIGQHEGATAGSGCYMCSLGPGVLLYIDTHTHTRERERDRNRNRRGQERESVGDRRNKYTTITLREPRAVDPQESTRSLLAFLSARGLR